MRARRSRRRPVSCSSIKASPRLSLVSHSWGSMPACRFAGKHPAMVDRVVLFGPIARRPQAALRSPRRRARPGGSSRWKINGSGSSRTCRPATARAVAPAFRRMGRALSRQRPREPRPRPGRRENPGGPFIDILRAWHGELAYDPALVTAPVAIIRGEWDGVIPDEDATWLFDAFTASPIQARHQDRSRHASHASRG